MTEGKTCCCGCCSVRTGTIIIVAYRLIATAWNIFASSSQLAILTDKEKYDANKLVQLNAHADGVYKEAMKELYINHRELATILAMLGLTAELINTPLSALCLYGAVKKGPAVHLRLWIYYNAFSAVLSALLTIVMGIYLTQHLEGALVFDLALLLAFLAAYGLVFYLIRVVYFFKQEIRETETDGRAGACVQEHVTFDGIGIRWVDVDGSGRGSGNANVGREAPPPYQEKVDHPI